MAAVGLNCDGSGIAIRVSSTWDEGEEWFKAHPVIPWLGMRKVRNKVKVYCSLSFPPPDPFALFILTLLTLPFVIAEVVYGKLTVLGY